MRTRRILQLLAMVLVVGIGPARASTSSSEITDMWWNPGESGWGVNVVQQRDVAFLTFFVYDRNGSPVWYTSDAHLATDGTPVWSGNLFATTGPWFGGPFTMPVRGGVVGTVSFALVDLNQATLAYSVNGTSVNKTLQRQTWTNEDYTGDYLGGYSVTNANCTNAGLNGIEEAGGVLSVVQNGAAISVSSVTPVASCTYGGTYTQTGKLGQVDGSFNCSNGIQGSFVLVEMTPTISGFTGRISGQNQFCRFSGYLGGVRRSR